MNQKGSTSRPTPTSCLLTGDRVDSRRSYLHKVEISQLYANLEAELLNFGRQSGASVRCVLRSHRIALPPPRRSLVRCVLRSHRIAPPASTWVPPPTSVDSERLFSAVSHVVDEKRNRIACDKAEMLIFVKTNLPLLINEPKLKTYLDQTI